MFLSSFQNLTPCVKNIFVIFHGFQSETKQKDIFYWRSEALEMSWCFLNGKSTNEYGFIKVRFLYTL